MQRKAEEAAPEEEQERKGGQPARPQRLREGR